MSEVKLEDEDDDIYCQEINEMFNSHDPDIMELLEKQSKWVTPMGFKIDLEEYDNQEEYDFEKLIEKLKTYHNGVYVVGKDTQFCDRPHFHIHWWTTKAVTKGACKTFRSTHFKCFGRKSKMYLGQDLPSSDKYQWLGYAIKEHLCTWSGFSNNEKEAITETARTQKEIKLLKKIHSEKKSSEEKIKKDFKLKILDYVNKNYHIYCDQNGYEYEDGENIKVIRILIIACICENEKYGSLRQHHIKSYVLQYLIIYCQYTYEKIDMYLKLTS